LQLKGYYNVNERRDVEQLDFTFQVLKKQTHLLSNVIE
jgi:hypothetical protein